VKARAAGILLAGLISAGCVTINENVGSMSEIDTGSVMVVGKIQIIPPIKPGEQTFKANDPFNGQRNIMGRAIMFVSDKPEYQERTDLALNPPLEETFFLKVPRTQRYMVRGSVMMSFAMRVVSARQATTSQSDLLFPAPIEFDIRPGDKVIYVGTLRMHRDEFHEVTKAEVRDDYTAALADYRKKFGNGPAPRKALLKPAKTK
jgi:hypothetical protein